MRVRAFAYFFLILSTGVWFECGNQRPIQSAPIGGNVLYVISNNVVTTYSVDPNSLEVVPVEQPATLVTTGTLLQFDPSPDDRFVYTVWADGQTVQHLSVFSTDSAGVPQTPAIQVLNATALSQFNLHPSGRFAYMLEVTNSAGLYQADIRLFHAQPTEGTLNEDPRVQGTYGPSYNHWPASLYGFSADGSKLYDTSPITTGSIYRERSINLNTGVLGDDTELLTSESHADVAIRKQVIVEQYVSDSNPTQNYVNVFWNKPHTGRAVIDCSAVMIGLCATASSVQFDPSGDYLFFADKPSQRVHVTSINLTRKRITDTGSSIPMTAHVPGVVFSPDGRIVYAQLAADNSLHFYHFERGSGALIEGGTPLPLLAGAGICPAQWH